MKLQRSSLHESIQQEQKNLLNATTFQVGLINGSRLKFAKHIYDYQMKSSYQNPLFHAGRNVHVQSRFTLSNLTITS
jgi:hypothetical protein